MPDTPISPVSAADALIESLTVCCIDTISRNPGTTERTLVAALDHAKHPIKAVLGLLENVCSAAADGYWRTSGRPAATLLRLGPGLTNSAANLHNARRASGEIKLIEDVLIGLDQASAALLRVVNGANSNKKLVRIEE